MKTFLLCERFCGQAFNFYQKSCILERNRTPVRRDEWLFEVTGVEDDLFSTHMWRGDRSAAARPVFDCWQGWRGAFAANYTSWRCIFWLHFGRKGAVCVNYKRAWVYQHVSSVNMRHLNLSKVQVQLEALITTWLMMAPDNSAEPPDPCGVFFLPSLFLCSPNCLYLFAVLLFLGLAELLLNGAIQLTEQSHLLAVLQKTCWRWRLVWKWKDLSF